MKNKLYKVRVSYENDIEVIVEDTNGNRAVEIAREYVKKIFKDCRITAGRLEGIEDNAKYVINLKNNK